MDQLRQGKSDAGAVRGTFYAVSALARLSSRMGLALAGQQTLLAEAALPRQAQKDECLIEQSEETSSLFLLCSGMARAVRTLADGRQQIVAVFVAGDALNARDLVFHQAPNSVSALTRASYLSIPLRQLRQLAIENPSIAGALWLETAAQSAIQQEWMVWLGRGVAQTRLAHFLCEVSYRLQLSGRDTEDGFEFPLTQREMADTLGLSPVHVNRTLQVLRSQGLIELNHYRLMIRNKAGLYRVAEFDPRYLDGLKVPDLGAT